ncbi:MAG: hypothetical protein J0L93_00135 [Deltaproteobacteria bacterium]|nr:hypothetical protein [Deltaproteobacteria bacterium]
MKKYFQIFFNLILMIMVTNQILIAAPSKTKSPPVDESGRVLTCPACDTSTIFLNEDTCPANFSTSKPSATVAAKDSAMIACPTSVCGTGSLLPPGALMNLYISGSNTVDAVNISSIQGAQISGDYFLFKAPIFLKVSSVAWLKFVSGSKNLCAAISGTSIDNAATAAANSNSSNSAANCGVIVESTNLPGQLVSFVLLLSATLFTLGLRRSAFQKTKSPK